MASSTPAMALQVASKDAPMTLRRRQALEQIHIPFHVAPHEMIFTVPILDVLGKQHLCVYVDNLLLKLNHEYPNHDTPSPGHWKLMINDIEENLNKWNPQSLKLGTPVLIVPKIANLLPITTAPLTLTLSSWAWANEMRSLRLPTDVVFVLQGDSHLLITLLCQTKVKISNRQRRIDETIHKVLIPGHYTAGEVLKLVRANVVGRMFQDPNANDLREDNRSASELGWKDGTTLRLELW